MTTSDNETAPPSLINPIQNFREIANFAPVMIWTSGLDMLCDWFNKPWLEFTGRPLSNELGDGWSAGIHYEDIERCYEIYKKAFAEKKQFSVDFRLKRHDGVYRWILGNGAPMFSSEGLFTGYIGSCTDIQDRIELELEVQKQSDEVVRFNHQLQQTIEASETRKRLYETILSATPDFIYTFEFGEDSHRFAYANDRLLKMFGKNYEETVGKTFLEIGYEPWHADLHNTEIDTVRRTKEPLRGEVPFNGTYGRKIYDYIFAPVFDVNGNVEAVAGITRDVTERHEHEAILRKNEEAMSDASRRKDEFLAMLAHELRNPLAPISAANQIMSLSNFEEGRVRKSSQIIARQLKHMVGLIDDLLDVSRVTRGLVEVEKSPQDLISAINSSIEQIRPLLESKHHKLTMNFYSGLILVMGDLKRLVQIFANVLNNSVKYTQDGGQINITAEVVERKVVISISDDGVGIAKEDQHAVFELFAQAKRTSDRSQGGLGIGLALVKSLLELHDGSIVCFSDGIGTGSLFKIELPLFLDQRSTNRHPNEYEIKAQNKLSILVVDDNVDAAISLASLLELSGHDVHVEHDSINALEFVIQNRPSVCILDIGLPIMDGNELARRIKAHPQLLHIILIAVTGYGQKSDKEEAINAGFMQHLVKPIDFEALLELLNTVSV